MDGAISRWVGVAAIAGLAVGLSVPVMAGHVTEPTAPVTAVTLELGNYVTGERVDCGSQVSFDALRFNVDVTAESAPSEHFTVRIIVAKGPSAQKINQADWDVLWPHQNIPPHERMPWQAVQSDQYDLSQHVGFWTVRVIVSGQESGATFDRSCTVERV